MLGILFTILLVAFLILLITAQFLGAISDVYGSVTITVGVITIISLVLVIIEEPQSPTAMDVYQGKTTLEITYKDGVAVDSVVVFKERK